ncbi:MAG: hypothetical protein ABH811_01725, partial [archaeon]
MDKKIVMILVGFMFLSALNFVSAENYYVSPTGTATWSSCTNINTPCSLDTANSNAKAGDVVNLRGGIYAGQSIMPVNSGTASNKIIYKSYNSESVVLDDTGEVIGAPYGLGVLLERVDYIVIDGITIQNQERPVSIYHGASHNEIKNCIIKEAIYNIGGAGSARLINILDGQGDDGGSNHNWIHHNIMYKSGHIGGTGCEDYGGVVGVGAYNSDYISNYNTIENNILYHGGHYVVQTNTQYNIVRNNIIHNEGFMNDDNPNCNPKTTSWHESGYWGNRVMAINDGYNRSMINNLIENNRVGHGSNPPDGGGANGIVLTGAGNIVRHNYIFDSGQHGVYFKQITNGDSDNNRVYSNTLYHTGYSYGQLGNVAFGAVYIHGESSQNFIKNNIVYDVHPDVWDFRGNLVGNTLTNNWITSNGDPKFTNPDISDPTSKTLPDLSLQSSSAAIDNGTYLTKVAVSDTGSGTTLIVDDALYFQDGKWGSSLSNIRPDWIAIGSVGNVVEISSINYNTNVITLADSISRNDGDSVWLYKDSTGRKVLYGNAPDVGAYEFVFDSVTCQQGDQYKIIDSTNIQVCSCEQVDVQAAVDAASAGDTVKVP